jgi:O-antigen ligase
MKFHYYIWIFLITLFTSLAFGGAEPWGLLLFNIACSGLGLYILFKHDKFYFTGASKTILGLLCFIILLAVIQLFNQHNFLQKPAFLPFTLCRYYTFEGLSLLFSLTLFYFALSQIVEKTKEIKIVALLITVVAIIIGFIGITWQRGEYIGLFTDVSRVYSFGPFTSRNHGSQFMLASFFISLCLWLPHFLLDVKRRLPYKNIWFFTFSLILFIGVFFTHSRGGVIALMIGFFVLSSLCSAFLIKKKSKKFLSIACITFIFTGLIFLVIQYSANIGLRQFGTFSDKARLLLYGTAFDMLKDFPWTGVGFDAFSGAIDAYLKVSLKAFPRYLHNDWLELLLSFGYIYGSIIFAFIGFIIYKIARLFKELEPKKQVRLAIFCAGLAGFCFTGVIDFPFHMPACALLFFSLLAFATARTFDNRIKTKTIPLFFKIIVVCVSFGLIGANIQYFRTWRSFVFARKLTPSSQIEQITKDLNYYPSPIFIKRVLLANYKISQDKRLSIQEQEEQRIKTHKLAEFYLRKYPKDKEISQFFILTK